MWVIVYQMLQVQSDEVIDVSKGMPTAETVTVLMCDGASSCVENEGLGVSMGAVSTCY